MVGGFFKRFTFRVKPKPVPVPPVPVGDLPKQRHQGQKVEAKEVRELAELIRLRYTLDVDLWNHRFTKPRDRHIIEDKIRKADATLAKVRGIVDSWDVPDAFEEDGQDWSKLRNIKRRVGAEGKRNWAINPPWQT
jgi:hypothetical protein